MSLAQYQGNSDLGMSFLEEESFQEGDKAPTKFEPDSSKIDFLCVCTGKSAPPGVLHTHGSHFKYFKHGKSKDGLYIYFNCSEKKAHGCLARAILLVEYPEPPDGHDGPMDPVPVRLIEVATPEFHAQWQTADNSKFIAHQILQVMKQEVEKIQQTRLVSVSLIGVSLGKLSFILRADG